MGTRSHWGQEQNFEVRKNSAARRSFVALKKKALQAMAKRMAPPNQSMAHCLGYQIETPSKENKPTE